MNHKISLFNQTRALGGVSAVPFDPRSGWDYSPWSWDTGVPPGGGSSPGLRQIQAGYSYGFPPEEDWEEGWGGLDARTAHRFVANRPLVAGKAVTLVWVLDYRLENNGPGSAPHAWTMAHEIGHVLGLKHSDEEPAVNPSSLTWGYFKLRRGNAKHRLMISSDSYDDTKPPPRVLIKGEWDRIQHGISEKIAPLQ